MRDGVSLEQKPFMANNFVWQKRKVTNAAIKRLQSQLPLHKPQSPGEFRLREAIEEYGKNHPNKKQKKLYKISSD
jgi:hypothetical protein